MLARRTTRLVAVSPEVRDELVALGVAPPERFSVIRLGLDLERRIASAEGDESEFRALFGIAPSSFVVGWVGRMTAIKRVPDVLEAFGRLREQGIDATLCLVGDGPDRELVERRAHELGVSRNTVFVGYQRDVAPYYSFFDVLLLTSANEGTPAVAIEALAAGTPVVATDVGGVADVVADGLDGILVPEGDIEALAAALGRLARDRELALRMGVAGSERVVERYRVERLVDDVDRLYRELLEDAGLPPPPRSLVATAALLPARRTALARGPETRPPPGLPLQARTGSRPSATNQRLRSPRRARPRAPSRESASPA